MNPWVLENRITNSTRDSTFIPLLELKIWIRMFHFVSWDILEELKFVLKMTTTKNRSVVGFLWQWNFCSEKLKTMQVLRTSVVEVGNPSNSKFWESNDCPESKFWLCEPMSHRTSKNFHLALAKTEPVTSSEDAIGPIRKFCHNIFSWISFNPISTPGPPQSMTCKCLARRYFKPSNTNLSVSWKIWLPDKGRISKLVAKFGNKVNNKRPTWCAHNFRRAQNKTESNKTKQSWVEKGG